MKKIINRFLIFFIIVVVASQSLSPLSSIASYNKTSSLAYLQQHPTSPWSILGQIASGSTSISVDSLKNISGTLATDYEVPILAIAAAGQNPQTFGTTDYVAKLKTFYSNGQIGDSTILNDDIFGILALSAAKLPATDEVLTAEKSYLIAQQNSDGGWSFSKGGASDSNTTAAAITALISLGLTGSDSQMVKALDYLKTCQNSDGGFTYDPKSSYGTDSDSSSTAWVLWALNALGISHSSWSKDGHSPADYLEANQTTAGYFSYQNGTAEDSFSPITTAYAAIALAGKFLPLPPLSQPALETFDFRIEGAENQVCSGQAQGPTALAVIENASGPCGFSYHIKQASFGKYLDQINNDVASGQSGWMYLVNNSSPDVGAADYTLKQGDEVLWYFGDFGWKPTRLSANTEKTSGGGSIQTKTEYYNNGSWQALNQATITFGALSLLTDSSGNATLSAPDGFYKTSAGKPGYIRSNQILLQFGDPSTSAVNLVADIGSGQVQGTSTKPSTISFTVNATSLDFGNVKPGTAVNKTLTISNNGTVGLNLAGVVAGDRAFVDYLNINGKTWQKFSTNLSAGQNEEQTLKLSIPSGYSGASGKKTGQLIFWAMVAN